MLPPSVDEARAPKLADRLEAARRGRFVGRLTELDVFRSALVGPDPPFAVLHLYGPGGVGKTSLLREYARLATAAGRSLIHLDARTFDPSPPGFLAAVQRAMAGLQDDPASVAARWPPEGVWLIDTFELIAPLDTWLRETFLPQLPARSLVVIAGRHPPPPEWRTDVDWADLTSLLPLGNLCPEESQTYLAARGVPEEHHAEVLDFSRGHPLALALTADVLSRGETLAAFDPRGEPDVVRVLLERLVRDLPSPAHRLALEVCVRVWATTETLLADVVGREQAHNLFAWLRQQSFIELGPHGIFPHDLARDVLDADFRWRDPGGYRQLNARVVSSLHAWLEQARGTESQRIWFDLLFLSRQNPGIRPYFDWSALGGAYAEPASPHDHDAILDMVRRHQGDDAMRIADHWLRRQPRAFLVYRDIASEVFGFMAHVALHDATSDDIAADPAASAALAYAQRQAPIRPGEEVVYLRFWMHREHYQDVSPALNLTAINSSIHWTTHPRLAWNFIAVSDPDFLAPHFASIHIRRAPEADFEVGGCRYGVFAHDWRAEPAAEWLNIKSQLMADATRGHEQPDSSSAPAFAALSQEQFADAVRQALRDFTQPDRLAANPLVHTRLVAARTEGGPAPATLQALLRVAVGPLTADPKSAKLHRALWHTYFEPAPTQEQAAELLGLPFNTYRYHLAKGIERITDWLRRRELEGDGVSDSARIARTSID